MFLIVALLLSACGGAPTQAPAQVPAATENPVTTQAPAEQGAPAGSAPVEVSFMAWGAPEELAVWQQIVDDFEAANPNIKVNVEVSDWDSYWEKLKTLLGCQYTSGCVCYGCPAIP